MAEFNVLASSFFQVYFFIRELLRRSNLRLAIPLVEKLSLELNSLRVDGTEVALLASVSLLNTGKIRTGKSV